MKKFLITAAITLITVSSTAFGQRTEAERLQQEREKAVQQQRAREFQDMMQRQGDEQQGKLEQWAREKRIENLRGKVRILSGKELKAIRAALSPRPEDKLKYADFLRQPKTGLFRLMPDRGCNQKFVVSASEDCQSSTYMGEFYSFQRKDYSAKDFSDLLFKDGDLISQGFLSQTMLVALGDVPLESISLTSKGLSGLADFTPAAEIKEIKKQSKVISSGIDFDGYRYAKVEKAVLGNTYALRVIAYRPKYSYSRFAKYGMDAVGVKFWFISSDKREDLIIAFRIVRKDEDGSLSILWKELSRRKAPEITFRNDEPLTDISH